MDNPLYPREHLARVREQEQPIPRVAEQLEHADRVARRLRPDVVHVDGGLIDPAYVAPPPVVLATFVDEVRLDPEVVEDLLFIADDELIRVGVLELRVHRELRVVENQLRIARVRVLVVRPVERVQARDGRTDAVELAGDDAAIVASVVSLQQGATVLVQLQDDAQARREAVPREQVVERRTRLTGLVPEAIEHRVRRDLRGAAIVAQAKRERRARPDAIRVVRVEAPRGLRSALVPRDLRVAVGGHTSRRCRCSRSAP